MTANNLLQYLLLFILFNDIWKINETMELKYKIDNKYLVNFFCFIMNYKNNLFIYAKMQINM